MEGRDGRAILPVSALCLVMSPCFSSMSCDDKRETCSKSKKSKEGG